MGRPRKSSRPNHMTPAERADCLRFRAEGMSKSWLAEHFRRDIRTIERLLAKRRKAS